MHRNRIATPLSPRTGLSFGLALGSALLLGACQGPTGLRRAEPAAVTVKYDFDHRPLPEIPLPNDIATRPDDSSATGLRLNASMIAPTAMERRVREKVDGLDGWGAFQPITIPFTGPIDVRSVLAGHRDPDYRLDNDVVYLINVDRDSPEFGKVHPLDVGNGNYPVVMEDWNKYGPNDPNGDSLSLVFNERTEDLDGDGEIDPGEVDADQDGEVDPEEDVNGNGYLDPPEDLDADGVLDVPNYLPADVLAAEGKTPDPAPDDLAGRADALMTFYEKQTNTLIVSPMEPLRGRTTYAVVVTKRILDENGDPVGSPFPYINHTDQTDELEPLEEIVADLPYLSMDDIAHAFVYTVQSIDEPWIAVREGLYGLGPQAHIAEAFPARIGGFFPLKDPEVKPEFAGRNLYTLYYEDWKPALEEILTGLLGGDDDTEATRSLSESHRYIDYHVMGWYESPQLWERFVTDADGNVVVDENGVAVQRPLDEQSWPEDLDRVPADVRGERVYFWLTIPRKEVSARKDGKPVPVLLLGHGYTSNRVGETIAFAGLLAEFGIATLAIDNVSHGLALPPDQQMQAETLLALFGLSPLGEALQNHRAYDVDGDGVADSGVDFWTSYLFHTRDMMRQSALDYMQLIRILRTFDGTRRWDFDLDGDGQPELAGDFDGDGVLDVSAESPIYAMGGSLGGIMSTILGGVEPAVDAIVPIAGGGRLTDVGVRSRQGGVPEAVILRVMGPYFVVDVADDGTASVAMHATFGNDVAEMPLGEVADVLPGDTIVAENLDNGERSCAYVLPDEADNGVAGRARLPLAMDEGDRLVLRFYRGPVLVLGNEDCEVAEGFEPYRLFDKHTVAIEYGGKTIPAGELRAVTEGLGLRRTHPELRRFLSIGQMVLDPADPGVHARNMRGGLTYPELGERVATRALIVTTVGDMNVPASTGLTVARAAGFIDYRTPDPRYDDTPYAGASTNDVVIQTYTAEAVNIFERFTFSDDPSTGVHMDVENFSAGTDLWGDRVPRLFPPLRNLRTYPELDGGYSGAIFLYSIPEGQHGFARPGEQTDAKIRECGGGQITEPCRQMWRGEVFDVGWFMFHTIGAFATKPTESPIGAKCNTREQCNGIPDPPPERDLADLP